MLCDEHNKLKTLFKQICTCVDQQDYISIDQLFEHATVKDQTVLQMVSLLRYTYAVRHNLNNYHIYLDAVAQELLARGLDVERILQGLPFYSIDRYP